MSFPSRDYIHSVLMARSAEITKEREMNNGHIGWSPDYKSLPNVRDIFSCKEPKSFVQLDYSAVEIQVAAQAVASESELQKKITRLVALATDLLTDCPFPEDKAFAGQMLAEEIVRVFGGTV